MPPSNSIQCPLCDAKVSWPSFGKHITSLGHQTELRTAIKKRFISTTMTQLPSFEAKDHLYSVCFGCKKAYATLQTSHSCAHCDAHKTVVAQLVAEKAAERGVDISGAPSAPVSDDTLHMLQSQLIAMRRELTLLKTENTALKKENEQLKAARVAQGLSDVPANRFAAMSDDEFDAIDLDDLSEEEQQLWNGESEKREAAAKAARAARTVTEEEVKRVFEEQAARTAALKKAEEEAAAAEAAAVVQKAEEAKAPPLVPSENVVVKSDAVPRVTVGASAPLIPSPEPRTILGPYGPVKLVASTRTKLPPKRIGM